MFVLWFRAASQESLQGGADALLGSGVFIVDDDSNGSDSGADEPDELERQSNLESEQGGGDDDEDQVADPDALPAALLALPAEPQTSPTKARLEAEATSIACKGKGKSARAKLAAKCKAKAAAAKRKPAAAKAQCKAKAKAQTKPKAEPKPKATRKKKAESEAAAQPKRVRGKKPPVTFGLATLDRLLKPTANGAGSFPSQSPLSTAMASSQKVPDIA